MAGSPGFERIKWGRYLNKELDLEINRDEKNARKWHIMRAEKVLATFPSMRAATEFIESDLVGKAMEDIDAKLEATIAAFKITADIPDGEELQRAIKAELQEIASKEGFNAGIKGKDTKFMKGSIFMQQVRNLAMKKIDAEMTKGKPSLRHRTRRLFRSINIHTTSKLKRETGTGIYSIYFSYRVFPYQIFEPGVPSYDQERQAQIATDRRNPRRMITHNIVEAVREIAHRSETDFFVKQIGGHPAPSSWIEKYSMWRAYK